MVDLRWNRLREKAKQKEGYIGGGYNFNKEKITGKDIPNALNLPNLN